jgi:hypothetical protein
MDYHIIGDIHGQADKLEALLQHLGYRQQQGVYQQPGARVVFLGDFIDRGPHQRRVIDIVRPMVEQGHALAVMGNHEFNAIGYHTRHPETAEPLRTHGGKNTVQHQRFLDEYGLHEDETRSVIQWFKTLPIYLEVKDSQGGVLFRAVHACWSRPVIARVPRHLDDDDIVEASTRGKQTYEDIEVLLKGPEVPLPEGMSFLDKDGNPRHNIRIKWWNAGGPVSYRDIAMVPEGEEGELPATFIEDSQLGQYRYDPTEPPVFFGHYWLTGKPSLIGANLACLDYSAGKGGALVAYHWKTGDTGSLSSERFVTTVG